MINKWILNNFKSIESREELEFRPLTIFTGANSSGKSTILQSVLLVSQTLMSPIESRSIVLNGGIKKFGSYGDIVNQRKWQKELMVGFEIKDDLLGMRRSRSPWLDSIKNIHCEFVVGAQKEEDLRPYMKHLLLDCWDEKQKEAHLTLERVQGLSEELKAIVKAAKSIIEKEDLNYVVKYTIEDGFSRVRFDRGDNQNYLGASFTHFLPNYLVHYFDLHKKYCAEMMDRLITGTPSRYYGGVSDDYIQDIGEELAPKGGEVADRLYQLAKEQDMIRRKKSFEDKYRRYKELYDLEDLYDLFELSGLPATQKEPLAEVLKMELLSLAPSFELDRTYSHFIPGVEFIKEFFCEHIWYLGPLREEPKALYPLTSDGSIKDVGYRGENTAAVYDYNHNAKIEYVSPVAFNDLSDVKLKKKKGTLEDAVKEWLIYLNVASNIVTDEKGKIGHTMQISNDLNTPQDLTHVGVGVSQVLPILVMSLLAKTGDVIILEQPELHLHPKVQTRLADFFVSMNALGKQCLVETHSEYLINRLRYLVAKSETSKVADDTMIYFVTKEGMHSVYKPVNINKYGVIDEWPEGFFDESERIAAEVLKAGVEKRRKERLAEQQSKKG